MRKINFIMGMLLVATSAKAQPPASSGRLDAVVERGRQVMPFNLEKTLHVFDKTAYGGIQQVIANNAGDAEQIALIRRHLQEISQGFKNGDFSRQRRIHGADMPGLAELAADYANVRFDYRELPNGAAIEYSAEDSSLVDAIHRYFNAQLSDHARHAVGGKPEQCLHKMHRHGTMQPSLPKE